MIYKAIQELIHYGLKNKLITDYDIYVVRNELMEALGLKNWQNRRYEFQDKSLENIIGPLIDYACKNGIIPDTSLMRDLLDTKLMGVLTPSSGEVNRVYREKYALSPAAATDWYYDLSKKLNYIRAERMENDLKWKTHSEFGNLDITVNISKPEKDPKDIASLVKAEKTDYPKCPICPENAGFAGNMNHAARQNLRPVSVQIHGEEWQLQYSPYGYYNEHCILFNERHTPMVIDHEIFNKLFDAVDMFPHYFFGSNADLPIVGGSILSHEHFQGGRYTFAMETASVEMKFKMKHFPKVLAGTIKWPLSVIRLKSENRYQLVSACIEILDAWKKYSDENVFIFAETNGVPHNTVTPIARKKDKLYECDIVLRNNRTTQARPLGIFHPRPQLHHIKKENIGLIEVMGLAVLPARLKREMDELITEMLTGKIKESIHADWAEDILMRHSEFNTDNAVDIIRAEIGIVFEQVLADAGVFKRDCNGRAAFMRFLSRL